MEGRAALPNAPDADMLAPMQKDTPTLSARLGRFPRVDLARLPTPLEPMKRLSAHLGGPRLWVKREDATGVGMGGNKLRKLDYVLHEAVAAGADTLVSGGVVQSNSQRQVAAAAARLGMQCYLAVYHGRLAAPTPEYDTSGNAFLNRLFGAHMHDVPWTGDRNGAIESLAERLRQEGRRPYVVPYGVSNALGAVGYASAIAEIAAQSSAAGFRPSAIVHCTGSGATQAGLVIGASIALEGTRVVGIDIDAEPERVRADVVKYAQAAADRLGASFDESHVEVVAGHAGPAYGVPHQATIEAMKLAGSLEALVLDPVYSGKGLAGLLALARAGRWRADEDVVFIHTGGTPALFAYQSGLPI
ncbi:MAG TPA: D-cysteine desulfhydrase family protein [Sphingobium sp.]|nr:D-cysteine desulfhydrase family protein [Sphingobium sp.]